MYLNSNNPGECLVMAYDINRTTNFQQVGEGISAKSNPLRKTRNTNPKQSEGKTNATNEKIMSFLQAGKIIAAAERFPGDYEWSNYLYNEYYRHMDDGVHFAMSGAWITRQLFAAFCFLNRRKINKRSPLMVPDALEDLAQLCFEDYANRVRCGKPKYTTAQICKTVWGATPETLNWYRGIKPHFDFMWLILDFQNNRVLDSVADAARSQSGAVFYQPIKPSSKLTIFKNRKGALQSKKSQVT